LITDSVTLLGTGSFLASSSTFIRHLASGSYDCTCRLDGISAPTLVLQGAKDKHSTQDLVEEMHAGIKGSKVTMMKGGHLFFIWQNQQYTDAVTEFLGQL
jgi:pimeloyl-ACP methyl ester carboxylesterase